MNISYVDLAIFAAGTVALAPFITAIGATINSAVSRMVRAVVGLIMVKVEFEDAHFVAAPVLDYLTRNGKPIRIFNSGMACSLRQVYLESEAAHRSVYFRSTVASEQIFRMGPAVFWYEPPVNGNNNTAQKRASISFVRGTVNWTKLALAAAKAKDERDRENGESVICRRFYVQKHVGSKGKTKEGKAPDAGSGSTKMQWLWNGTTTSEQPIGIDPDDIGFPARATPLADLALTDAAIEVVKNVKFWLQHKNWYTDRGLSWRRGVGLYGLPGTGKTSLIRALAEELDIPVHAFNLASMDNQEFLAAWAMTQFGGSRIVLLEDFDSVFEGRTPKPGVELTFDTLLNAIDGVERQDGLLLFVTTNRKECLDDALGAPQADGTSTRPGRLDLLLDLPGIDHKGRVKIGTRITQDPELAERLALQYPNDTAAQFQERCAKIAREQFWAD